MQDLGIRQKMERRKYKDISWLMPSVDVESVLEKLGSIINNRSGKEIRAFCPDHHLFVGRRSSHPNWTVNIKTGETFCFTESRGSNLVFIVCNLMNCEPNEAAKFLLGENSDIDDGGLDISALKHIYGKISRKEEEEKAVVSGLNIIQKEIDSHYLSDAAYQFFIHPPGKVYPTNIYPETVDRYKVFERTWGYYSNRVIIPFFMQKVLVGFCAIDILGKKKWLEYHPTKTEDDYKKVLYPMNFLSGDFLFGYDDCEKGCECLGVVEGPREVMKLNQEGYANVVAVMGSHMSDQHLALIMKLSPKRVMLIFDGDDAGVEITRRVGIRLLRAFPGERVQKRFLTRGRDPKNLSRDELEKIMIFS
jgi:hypothetical protein